MPQVTISAPPIDLGGLSDAFKGDLSLISPMKVDVDISGIEEVKRNIHLLSQELIEDAVKESKRFAELLFEASEKEVPYHSGNLHDSEFIHEDDDSVDFKGFTVGYDAVGVQYAWYVHEVPAENYTKAGTKHHFLSDPAERLRAEYPDEMAQSLREAIRKSEAVKRASAGPRLVKKAK